MAVIFGEIDAVDDEVTLQNCSCPGDESAFGGVRKGQLVAGESDGNPGDLDPEDYRSVIKKPEIEQRRIVSQEEVNLENA